MSVTRLAWALLGRYERYFCLTLATAANLGLSVLFVQNSQSDLPLFQTTLWRISYILYTCKLYTYKVYTDILYTDILYTDILYTDKLYTYILYTLYSLYGIFFILTFFILYSKIKPDWKYSFQFLKFKKIARQKGENLYFFLIIKK